MTGANFGWIELVFFYGIAVGIRVAMAQNGPDAGEDAR